MTSQRSPAISFMTSFWQIRRSFLQKWRHKTNRCFVTSLWQIWRNYSSIVPYTKILKPLERNTPFSLHYKRKIQLVIIKNCAKNSRELITWLADKSKWGLIDSMGTWNTDGKYIALGKFRTRFEIFISDCILISMSCLLENRSKG